MFVNSTGGVPSDRNATTIARAFVTRNARSAQHWSPRSREKMGKQAIPTPKGEWPEVADLSANVARRPSRRGCGTYEKPGMEVVLQNELSITRPRRSSARSSRTHVPDHNVFASSVCEACRLAHQMPPSPASTAVSNDLDPFSSMAIKLESKNSHLLHYCQSVPIWLFSWFYGTGLANTGLNRQSSHQRHLAKPSPSFGHSTRLSRA